MPVSAARTAADSSFNGPQVAQLRVENTTLIKRLTEIGQKYNEAAVDNRILKADVEALRAKVRIMMHMTGVQDINNPDLDKEKVTALSRAKFLLTIPLS